MGLRGQAAQSDEQQHTDNNAGGGLMSRRDTSCSAASRQTVHYDMRQSHTQAGTSRWGAKSWFRRLLGTAEMVAGLIMAIKGAKSADGDLNNAGVIILLASVATAAIPPARFMLTSHCSLPGKADGWRAVKETGYTSFLCLFMLAAASFRISQDDCSDLIVGTIASLYALALVEILDATLTHCNVGAKLCGKSGSFVPQSAQGDQEALIGQAGGSAHSPGYGGVADKS